MTDRRDTAERREERAMWTKDIARMLREMTADPDHAAYVKAADWLDPPRKDRCTCIACTAGDPIAGHCFGVGGERWHECAALDAEATKMHTVTDETDRLSPTQYLMVEVLAARHRLGEPFWTFPSRLRPAAQALAGIGLAAYESAVTEGSIRVRLTEAGKTYALEPTYAPPMTELTPQPADQWTAPWTDEQVAALNAYQTSGRMHPYTCPHGGSHPPLIPTSEGWRCVGGCGYRQDWAHAIPPGLLVDPRPASMLRRVDFDIEPEDSTDPSVPDWTAGATAHALALLLARRRFGPGVDMGGRDNPNAGEEYDAKRFVRDMLDSGWLDPDDADRFRAERDEAIAARDKVWARENRVRERIQTWNDDPETRLQMLAISAERIDELTAGRDEARAEVDRMRPVLEAAKAVVEAWRDRLAVGAGEGLIPIDPLRVLAVHVDAYTTTHPEDDRG